MKVKRPPFALLREMLEAPDAVASFDVAGADRVLERILPAGRILLTGEGSSRLFPAKHAVARALSFGLPQLFHTEACHQALEIDLDGWTVFGTSNSGRTRELLILFRELRRRGIPSVGITAARRTPLARIAGETFVLSCGTEKAVPATKTVIAEALFLDHLVHRSAGRSLTPLLRSLPALSKRVLEAPVDPRIVRAGADAERIFFAGRNDGVAEELSLKTIEITRKLSVYLEGTFALHGIEEVAAPKDLLVLVDPFEEEEGRFERAFRTRIGMPLVTIASRPTRFPTIRIPRASSMKGYLQLMAGWNLLTRIGLALGHNLDKPKRARKIGNEA